MEYLVWFIEYCIESEKQNGCVGTEGCKYISCFPSWSCGWQRWGLLPCLSTWESIKMHVTSQGKRSKFKIWSTVSTECVSLSHHWKVKNHEPSVFILINSLRLACLIWYFPTDPFSSESIKDSEHDLALLPSPVLTQCLECAINPELQHHLRAVVVLMDLVLDGLPNHTWGIFHVH